VARPLGARRRLAAAALFALTASVVFATLGFARPPPDDGRTLLFVGATMAALGGAAVIWVRRFRRWSPERLPWVGLAPRALHGAARCVESEVTLADVRVTPEGHLHEAPRATRRRARGRASA
jgi:hypothetical protein